MCACKRRHLRIYQRPVRDKRLIYCNTRQKPIRLFGIVPDESMTCDEARVGHHGHGGRYPAPENSGAGETEKLPPPNPSIHVPELAFAFHIATQQPHSPIGAHSTGYQASSKLSDPPITIMPPRISSSSAALAADLALPHQAMAAAPFARSFSSTQYREKMSRARQQMYQWLKSRDGQELAAGKGPRYLGPFQDQPFPQNPLFRSQPVLDEHTRELIWEKVTQRGESLKAVSAEIGVDVRRVAAVVRLKEVERQWVKDVSVTIFALRFPWSDPKDALYMMRPV